MSLVFHESDPYSRTGWIPYSLLNEISPKQTPIGITMPEHKGKFQSVIFDSRDKDGESVIYLASPMADLNDTGDKAGHMQPLATLKKGESFYFAPDDYILDDVGFDYYPSVVRVTQT
jgi:hypothetical protein